MDTEEKMKAFFGFLKGSGIAGALLIPFGSLSFAFIFKDLIAAVTNLLIYIGMVSSSFGINGKSANGHKDPFDRLLIAQAGVENYKLLTEDSKIQNYNKDWIIPSPS